jgi:uncharacterized glyoxalase superfamily protein PhnB
MLLKKAGIGYSYTMVKPGRRFFNTVGPCALCCPGNRSPQPAVAIFAHMANERITSKTEVLVKPGIEIDMVVPDSLGAFNLYQKVFNAEKIEATSYTKGHNEAVFTIYGARFHVLDENPECGLAAPKDSSPMPMWCNIIVEDIARTCGKATEAGFTTIQPVTEMKQMGVINAVLKDPFGYVWMLHQIVREISFEERCKIMEQEFGIKSGGAAT